MTRSRAHLAPKRRRPAPANGGRQTGRRYPDGSRVTLAYDAVGSRTLMQDSLGRYTATFDSLNRTRTATTPAGKTITYAYDSGSQRRYMIDPDGGRFTYAFDALGRNNLVVNPQSERTTWTFDAGGRTTVQQLANGCRASYAYDQGNRLLRLANLKSDGTTLSSFRDSWDNSGNRTSRIEADGVRVTWNYDATYQLTREQRSGGNAYDIQYAYDNASNRRTKLENSITTTYAYDSANQLSTLKDNTGTTSFTFDSAGNQQIELTPAAARTTNAWDYENRLTKVQLPSSITNTFAYNPDNLRVKTQDSTGTLKQIWDGQKVLVETDGSDVTQVAYSSSTELFGKLTSQRRSGATGLYLFDPLGSTDRLADATQSITDSYIYKAFGVIAASSGSTVNPWRFVGRAGYYWEHDLSELYVRRRHYNPVRGRWLSIDPIISVSSPTPYEYSKNCPVVLADPSGLFAGMEWLLFQELLKASMAVCKWVGELDLPRTAGIQCLCGLGGVADLFSDNVLIEAFDCLCNAVGMCQKFMDGDIWAGIALFPCTLADCLTLPIPPGFDDAIDWLVWSIQNLINNASAGQPGATILPLQQIKACMKMFKPKPPVLGPNDPLPERPGWKTAGQVCEEYCVHKVPPGNEVFMNWCMTNCADYGPDENRWPEWPSE